MKNNEPLSPNEPRLGDTFREDLRRRDLWRTFRREIRDLRTFYIDEEKQSRLDQMGWLKRWLYFLGWILKSMLLKLTPVRRLLMFLGIFLLVMGETIHIDGSSVRTENWSLMGGVILVFVLMLELKDKLLARNELEAGRQIQRALMPHSQPDVPGWSIWLFSKPANEVGGDLVDFLQFSKQRSFLVLGDVSGKGLSAALLMAKLQSTVRAIATTDRSIKKLAGRINQIFHRDSLRNMFASLLYSEINFRTGKITFSNAGHLPPLLISKKSIKEMPKGEPAIGLAEGTKYSERSLMLKKGDIFFAYSDGVIEARNDFGTFYSKERLFDLLHTVRDLSAPEVGETILSSIDQFVNEAHTNDDISIIILKRM